MKAAIYARYSNDMQDHTSIDGQQWRTKYWSTEHMGNKHDADGTERKRRSRETGKNQ